MEEAAPLHSLAALAAWAPGSAPHCAGRVPLRRRPRAPARRVVVCHDMAGGYGEDRFVQGRAGAGAGSAYALQHWQLVDALVYFSHARVAPPPPCWTAAAHRNGVSVLGTFITEGECAVIENARLVAGPDAVLDDGNPRFNPFFADKLVAMAKTYSFDGWFFNIETPMPSAKYAWVFVEFLNYITARIHDEIPGSEIMCYDSLITTGAVAWQNKATILNLPYCYASDSFFVNYFWKSFGPFESAELVGERARNVITGIDTWGRGTYGGGGFNCHKALRVANLAGTSAAIFAPAWTYEALGTANFLQQDRRFWIDTSVALKGLEDKFDQDDVGCVADQVEARVCPSAGFVYSNFDRGFGESMFLHGLRISGTAWSDITHQSLFPSFYHSTALFEYNKGAIREFDPGSRYIYQDFTSGVAFLGGSSLQLECVACAETSTAAISGEPQLRVVTKSGKLRDDRFYVTIQPIFKVEMSAAEPLRVSIRWRAPAPLEQGVQIGVYAKTAAAGYVLIDDLPQSAAAPSRESWALASFDLIEFPRDATVQELGISIIHTRHLPVGFYAQVGELKVQHFPDKDDQEGKIKSIAARWIPEKQVLRIAWTFDKDRTPDETRPRQTAYVFAVPETSGDTVTRVFLGRTLLDYYLVEEETASTWQQKSSFFRAQVILVNHLGVEVDRAQSSKVSTSL